MEQQNGETKTLKTWQQIWDDFFENDFPNIDFENWRDRDAVRQIQRHIKVGKIKDSRRVRECIEKHKPGSVVWIDGGWSES